VAVAEQRRQQHLLRGAGVLVLVEQHHAAGRPLELATSGQAGRAPAASATTSPKSSSSRSRLSAE
jgi:hypothetical protein